MEKKFAASENFFLSLFHVAQISFRRAEEEELKKEKKKTAKKKMKDMNFRAYHAKNCKKTRVDYYLEIAHKNYFFCHKTDMIIIIVVKIS